MWFSYLYLLINEHLEWPLGKYYSFVYKSVNFQFFSPRFDRDKVLFQPEKCRYYLQKNHDFVGETKLSLQVRQGMLNDAGFNNYENEIKFYNILFAFPTVVTAFNNDVSGRTFN